MQVKKLRQVFLVAHDLESQARFYRDALGLEEQFRDGDRWVQFAAGGVSFALAGAEESMGAAHGSSAPVFEVDCIDAARDRMLAAGAQVGTVRDMGAHGRSLAVTDPSGAFFVLFAKPSPS